MGQFQEAIICLENVHRNWCEAWNQKGIAYANLKKYFEAITCFEKAIKFDTDNQSVYAENKARAIKEQEENNV